MLNQIWLLHLQMLIWEDKSGSHVFSSKDPLLKKKKKPGSFSLLFPNFPHTFSKYVFLPFPLTFEMSYLTNPSPEGTAK